MWDLKTIVEINRVGAVAPHTQLDTSKIQKASKPIEREGEIISLPKRPIGCDCCRVA